MDIITGKILKYHNWIDGRIIGIAKDIGNKLIEGGMERDAALAKLDAVRQNPGSFLAVPLFAELARECIRISQKDESPNLNLRDQPLQYPIWGREHIDEGSLAQMDNAMRLPVSVAGALMPDAHVGYGLPIGGVLATENAIIPYAVGVDIACRMRLSLYEVSPILLEQKKGMFENALWEETAFGMGAEWKGTRRADHAVLDDPTWQATRLLQSLRDNAVKHSARAAREITSSSGVRSVCTSRCLACSPANISRRSRTAVRARLDSKSQTATANWRWNCILISIRASVILRGFRWIPKKVRNIGFPWNWLANSRRRIIT
ncbi:MAG: hypothetical protein HND47_15080 [Chloroflexi bacterium]|nr:hypothetical protein [Chloroflexota bacterium]